MHNGFAKILKNNCRSRIRRQNSIRGNAEPLNLWESKHPKNIYTNLKKGAKSWSVVAMCNNSNLWPTMTRPYLTPWRHDALELSGQKSSTLRANSLAHLITCFGAKTATFSVLMENSKNEKCSFLSEHLTIFTKSKFSREGGEGGQMPHTTPSPCENVCLVNLPLFDVKFLWMAIKGIFLGLNMCS